MTKEIPGGCDSRTMEATLTEALLGGLPIAPPDDGAARRARDRWNAVAKPIGSLGVFEDAVVSIAALTGSEDVDLSQRCVVVLCSDNGVVAEGVSQSDADVTAIVARNVARGASSLNRLCEPVHVDCVCVDMGILSPLDEPGMIDRRVAAGTADIARGPAMTRAQALQAIGVGIDLVGMLVRKGYRLIGTGEVGIGNTTTATAMACAFTGMGPDCLAGRGAGLSDEGLSRKVRAIRRALEVNAPDAHDSLGVLASLGGFDIAGMCGMFLGGALHRVPIVADGVISTVAAYCAYLLRPECRQAILASHRSTEPAASELLRLLDLHPPIDAGMHLGEGTGAACLIPLLDMALSLYGTGTTFADCGMEPYEVRSR